MNCNNIDTADNRGFKHKRIVVQPGTGCPTAVVLLLTVTSRLDASHCALWIFDFRRGAASLTLPTKVVIAFG